MRPNRASSWNINVIGAPWAQSLRSCWIFSGCFFPVLLRLRVTLRMLFIGRELSPAVAMQQVVDRGQGHGATQRRLQDRLDLRHHQHPAGTRAIQEGLEHLDLPFRAEPMDVEMELAATAAGSI